MRLFLRKFNRLNCGFTLVETLVAISIFTVSLLGIMSVLASGIANTTYAKQKMIATYLAQEGIEIIRNMRDTQVIYGGSDHAKNWTNFTGINHCGDKGKGQGKDKTCYFDDEIDFSEDDKPILDKELLEICSNGKKACPSLYYHSNTGKYDQNPSGGVNSGFNRSIDSELTPGKDKEIKVFSTVTWKQGSGTYSVVFSEVMRDWVE